MRELELDIRAADDRHELHGLIRAAFDFRDAYGENLDALFDALTSVRADTQVTVRYRPDKSQPYLNYQNKMLHVMHDAQQENHHLRFELQPEE